jgi:hypothetical protein
MFCSIPCRNSANGKRSGGHNRLPSETHTCTVCGKEFTITGGEANQRRSLGGIFTCSRACHNKRIAEPRFGADNPTWKGGIQTYRRHRRDSCERCGSTNRLVVHHKDENRYNNDLSNLETLCRRCHQNHHAEPRRDPGSGRYT